MSGIKPLWTLGWLKLSVGGLQLESDFHEFTKGCVRSSETGPLLESKTTLTTCF